MFGRNPIMKLDHGDGSALRIVKSSPFLTFQGEGPYVGHPAVFIRLHGCHLACTFCDTEFSDPEDPTVTIHEIVDRVLFIKRLNKGFSNSQHNLVVITGGEPMRQNILPLCEMLLVNGFRVQIETAGSFWIDGINEVADIIVSPKTGMVHPMIREKATAFKYIINAGTQILNGVPCGDTQGRGQVKMFAGPRADCPVYLSPMDEQDDEKNKKNMARVAQLSDQYGYIIGVQMHKLYGVD